MGLRGPDADYGRVGHRDADVDEVVVEGGVGGAIAVDRLHAEGVRVVMITGDARPVAESVAAELGVDDVFAEVLPADKDAAVAELQGAPARSSMVTGRPR